MNFLGDFPGLIVYTPPMFRNTDDVRIETQRALIPPAILVEESPLSERASQLVTESRQQIGRILHGQDDRVLAVVGPCSIHDPVAALDYAKKLKAVAARISDDVFVAMRVYFEKPRTVVGWKGLINDPFLDGSFQINAGLRLARKLMIDVTGLGLPVATEFLDTTLGQYYADLVSWGAIGARTVESQVHRELASGLSMPVGFKNRTDGDVQVAVDAIRSARHAHWFPSLTREGAPAVMGTAGNASGHLVLRGGSLGPNFSAPHIQTATGLLTKNQLPPYLMVDSSHANSVRDPEKQIDVAADLAGQISAGETAIAAVMLESNLLGGAQDYQTVPLVYGRSITDGCLAWEKTLPVFAQLAGAVKARRMRK